MQTIEREILRKLIEVAESRGLKAVRFAAQPGLKEDAVTSLDGLKLDECLKFAKEYDADSVIEFETTDGTLGFWVLLIWGNGEDFISDYANTKEAHVIVDAVYAWQKEGL